MSLSIGIIGLPNVGKSTLFKALTKQPIDISNYPFCTINPNVGIVAVPDERLEIINDTIKTPKMTPTVIEFVDIAGLVKNAHQGEGLGNQFLANIREVDAICHITRDFTNEKITHVENEINPKKDIEIINTELIMKDLETINNRIEKTTKQTRSGDKKILKELEILKKIKDLLERGTLISKEEEIMSHKQLIKELGLLTTKKMIHVLNISGNDSIPDSNLENTISLDLKLEVEISELSKEEAEEIGAPTSNLNELIKECYKALDLITFYTTGGPESRAWTIKKDSTAPQAGSAIHSDFEEKFIKAEIINWQKLIEVGSISSAREKGMLRIEGKKYIVQDGDVIEFKI